MSVLDIPNRGRVTAMPLLALLTMLTGCGGGSGGGSGGGGGGPPPATYSLSATISGLTESGLVLSVNGTLVSVSKGTTLVPLLTGLPSGGAYTATVSTQPLNERCTVTHGSGVIPGADVTAIAVDCLSMVEPVTSGPAARDLGGPSDGTLPSSGTVSVTLVSDPGDNTGEGKSYSYSNLNSTIRVGSGSGWLAITVDGTEAWQGWIHLPAGEGEFKPGTTTGLPYGFGQDGSLEWSLNNRHCGYSIGSLTVNSVTYVAGVMTAIDLNFDTNCSPPAIGGLHGHVIWSADGSNVVAAPVDPPPASLWRPSPGRTPSSGTYLYMESDPEDIIGVGRTLTMTPADSQIAVRTSYDGVSVTGQSTQNLLQVKLQALGGHARLQPGFYGQTERWRADNNLARGGLDIDLNLFGCNFSQGWFVVDAVSYTGGLITALDARFERHCYYWRSSMRGEIHWRADQVTVPAGPAAIPAGLWQAPASALPASGNYVYLDGDQGDIIFPGNNGPAPTPAQSILYVPDPSTTIKVATGAVTPGPGITVSVQSATDHWMGIFLAMYSLDRLEPGYYGPIAASFDPTSGTANWSGNGLSCGPLTTGWMAVDRISYSGSAVTGVDLRFEQHCDGAVPGLRGQVHWDSP